ncbi:MAG: extracellular solute-binding protein [Actinomycetota bacterium]
MTLRVALVGGPMYDHLYRVLDVADVEILVHADHPTLNRAVSDLLDRGERLDVISTHSKYAPSQSEWLLPLDDLVDSSELAPLAVDLCRPTDDLMCVPRLVDVRIMWWRRDRLPSAPDTWSALVESGAAFGFPGRESGLFGTFFELVVGAGGRLFDDEGRVTISSPEAEAAVETLTRLAKLAPADLPDWHYDQVDQALLDGRVDASGVWPGGWGAIRDSEIANLLEPALYPAGSHRRVSYSGCHAWAIPRTCGDPGHSAELVTRLVSREASGIDAAGGNVCAHVGAFENVKPSSPVDARRVQLTADTIRSSMITYPPHSRFPEVEDFGWMKINEVLRGRCSADDAVQSIHEHASSLMTIPES